ncbi:Hint domain-containing protein [Neomegalonema sp.]|uniref:Hint domain-containing protein n=1 Tax=Neomegalonema sp. TaxID=2039713 RepID=UPI00262FD248|nr:Hint domain-containing protein [Neomegalonema sp.]MDD2869665.1 Hint domain-containing protein [Neomegalonema sp.]
MTFRKLSIAKGLTVPDSCGCVICKGTREPAQELRLASLPAQWPEMRKLEKEFFNALMMEVTEHEKEILRVLKLPTIDTVREYYLTDKEDESKPFEYSQTMTALLARVFFKWREDILGTKSAKVVAESEAVFPFYMLDAFSMGYDKNFDKLLDALPDYVDPDEFEKKKKRVINLNNKYLMNAVKAGGLRIKTELGKEHLKDIIAELKDMAKNGTGSMTVARKIHNRVGEGKAWYWNRIARSEAALAADAAFSALVKEYQVPYERWEASATPGCDVCAYLDGQVFQADSGPKPVESSHPHSVEGDCLVYTYEGWRPIKEILVGDLVYTHNGNFKKVTELHRHTEFYQKMIELYLPDHGYKLRLSDNHPVSAIKKDSKIKEWIPAGDIDIFDTVEILLGSKLNNDLHFMGHVIVNIRKYMETTIDLYNLAVEDDESYIAQGFVVHNCRCLRVPVYVTDQPIQDSWNKTRPESPYDRPYSEEELELMRLGLPPTEENLRLITVQ